MTSNRSQEAWGQAPEALPVEGDVMGSVAQSPLSPSSRREWRLPSVPSSVSLLRRGLRVFLEDAGLSYDEREDLVLAACEAATNAGEHAQHSKEPFFDVAAQIAGDVVTIVVRDYGQWRAPGSSPHRGRGLAMMRVLAHTSVAAGADGTTVTLRSRRCGADALAESKGQAS
jgi:anti-sigma regulatory factor (Ser/Thr protein kinase)